MISDSAVLRPDDAYIHAVDVEAIGYTYYMTGQMADCYCPGARLDRAAYYPLSHIAPAEQDGRIRCQLMVGSQSHTFTMPATFLRWCVRGELPKAIY